MKGRLPPRPGFARRGIVFLVSALLLVAVFLVVVFLRERPTTAERDDSVAARIATMDDFLEDFHADLHRATYIAGFRSLIAVEEHIGEQGAFSADPAPIFIEAFLNGTIGGEEYEILRNSTFSEYLASVNERAGRVGMAVNATVNDITLGQSTPWSVDVTFDLVVNVTDLRGLARWDYEKPFTTSVSIIDLRDPAYSVETLGRLPNTFRVSPYADADLVRGNDTTNLSLELAAMYYREDPLAPSFLQRLAGNLTGSSKYGVASLVNLDDLDAQGVAVDPSRPVIDYLYFSNASTVRYCPGFGGPLPDWFRIDAAHYADAAHDYGLQGLNATTC